MKGVVRIILTMSTLEKKRGDFSPSSGFPMVPSLDVQTIAFADLYERRCSNYIDHVHLGEKEGEFSPSPGFPMVPSL